MEFYWCHWSSMSRYGSVQECALHQNRRFECTIILQTLPYIDNEIYFFNFKNQIFGCVGQIGKVVFSQEMYENFIYQASTPFFHTFETDTFVAGISWADESEGTAFLKKVESCKQQMPKPVSNGSVLLSSLLFCCLLLYSHTEFVNSSTFESLSKRHIHSQLISLLNSDDRVTSQDSFSASNKSEKKNKDKKKGKVILTNILSLLFSLSFSRSLFLFLF